MAELRNQLTNSHVKALEAKVAAFERQQPLYLRQIDTMHQRLARAKTEQDQYVTGSIVAGARSWCDRMLDELRQLRRLQRDTQRVVEQKLRDRVRCRANNNARNRNSLFASEDLVQTVILLLVKLA